MEANERLERFRGLCARAGEALLALLLKREAAFAIGESYHAACVLVVAEEMEARA